MSVVDVKHYTVAQVRDWLERNIIPDGLTNEVIRPAFAWALIHNPYVHDDDPIVAAIYDNGILAASTCAFPEIFDKPVLLDDKGKQKRIWWFPMLWVKPEFRGKAYGLVVIGSLAEIYGDDCSWTAWAVPESIEIFEYLGCATYYFPRYFMGDKRIQKKSVKSKLAALKQEIAKRWCNFRKPQLPNYDYELRYTTYVDNSSYAFIKEHCDGHFFLPQRDKLNWDVQYPWYVSSPLNTRVRKDGEYFSDINSNIQHLFVQVWSGDALRGVYRLCITNDSISVDNIYYHNDYSEIVYASVAEHIMRIRAKSFDTEDQSLAEFVRKYIYFPKCTEEPISLSVDKYINVPDRLK